MRSAKEQDIISNSKHCINAMTLYQFRVIVGLSISSHCINFESLYQFLVIVSISSHCCINFESLYHSIISNSKHCIVEYRFRAHRFAASARRTLIEYAHSAELTELTKETESAWDWQKATAADGSRQKLTKADERLWRWQSGSAALSGRRSRGWETGCVFSVFRVFSFHFLKEKKIQKLFFQFLFS